MTKYWISLSGGKGSAVSAILAYENGLDFEMVFADTKGEHATTYSFIIDLVAKIQRPFHWLVDGRDIWDVFIDERFIGNSRIAPCSKILKTKPVKKYLDQHAGQDDILVLGMDYSELDRIERAQKVWAPRKVVSLINEYKCYRPQWDAMLRRYVPYEPELYKMGFPHNNCAGACVRAGLKQWATLLERNPSEYQKAELGEKRATEAIGKRHTFLKKTWDKKSYGLTLEEFRLLVEGGHIEIDPFDFGGCGCFVDDAT